MLMHEPVAITPRPGDDAGVFDLNPRDERWLPFDGQGAVSTWSLRLDPRDNNFDLSSVTDVVCRLLMVTCIGVPVGTGGEPDTIPTGSRAVSVIGVELGIVAVAAAM